MCLLYTALLVAVHARAFGLDSGGADRFRSFPRNGMHSRRGELVRAAATHPPPVEQALGILAAREGERSRCLSSYSAAGWLLDQRYVDIWLTANVVVAFLHYAYDGMIWRRRAGS